MAGIWEKIPSRSLGHVAADRIRELIRLGHLKTGEHIIETELCARLGISRTPLREALRTLSSEGLVKLVPHRGAFVTHPSAGEIRDLFQVMEILEGACARMAAEKAEGDELQHLERLHEDLEHHYAARDHEAYIKTNNEVHTYIQELARNRALSDVLNGLRNKIFLHRYRQLYVQDRFDRSIDEHRELLEALRRRDAARADAVMKSHLAKQCDALIQGLSADDSQVA